MEDTKMEKREFHPQYIVFNLLATMSFQVGRYTIVLMNFFLFGQYLVFNLYIIPT